MTLLLSSNGKIGTKNGKLAIKGPGGTACCCEAVCCGCEWLEEYYNAGIGNDDYRIKVTFSGPITGYAILVPGGPTGGSPGVCAGWFTGGIGGDMTNVIDHCGLILNSVEFYCEGNILRLAVALGSASCRVINFQQISAYCGPPLEVVFTVELDDIFGGGCLLGGAGCDDGDILTMTIENMDPWP